MDEPNKTEGWSVLFIPAPSPGQIIRYLERRKYLAANAPETLFLSDGEGVPFCNRALIADFPAHPWMETVGQKLSVNFLPAVTLLYRTQTPSPRGGYAVWEKGEETLRVAFETSAAHPTGLFARLRRTPPLPPELAWAKRHHLPIDRIPAVSRATLPIVDYETVAKLDQKSLLVENSPRLYRFRLYI